MCTGQWKTFKMVPIISQGVRQGCVMSPWLFNTYIDGIIREAMDKFVGGVQLSNLKMQMLALPTILYWSLR